MLDKFSGDGNKGSRQESGEVDERIDLRMELCPLNFVKIKLKLEQMAAGQILEVLLDDGEAMRNVPRSVKDEGHEILKIERDANGFRVIIRKKG
jgi:tRNA 2-thiouridine synthesizing protein A